MLSARNGAAAFFFAGIFTCTWDLVLKLDLAGFTLKAHQGFFLLAFLLVNLSHLRDLPNNLKSLPLKKFGLLLLFLAIYYGVSAFRSEFPLKSFLYSGWIVFNLCTIWLTAILLREHLSHKALAWSTLCAASFKSALIMIDQIAYQFGYKGGLLGFNQDGFLDWGVSRPHGFAMEPSYVAAFLTFALLTGIALFRSTQQNAKPWVATALALMLFALVACTSRTGWFGSALGIAVFLGLGAIRARKFPWKEAGTALSAVAAISVIYYATISPSQRAALDQNFVSSIYQGKDGSGNARLRAHLQAWQMAKETGGLGTGLGASYKYWTSRYGSTELDKPDTFDQRSYGREVVMSIWGQLLAEGGIPAVLLYLAAAGILIQALWRQWQSTGDPLTQAALASALVFFLFTAFWLGNVARGDVWIWFAVWSRMALPDTGGENGVQRA